MAIATRLRMLSERVTKDSEKIFALYNVDIKPKWYPVFYSLSQDSGIKTVTAIANEIGHSHPSVISILKEMRKSGLIEENKDKEDGRKNNISLSNKGQKLALLIEEQYLDATCAIQKMLKNTNHNLWFALEEFENLLDEKSTYPRVLEEKKLREGKKIEIVKYEDIYEDIFSSLNKEWINEYFEMEDKDKQTLEYPKKYILDKGGFILVALYENKPVGVCALIKMQNSKYDYELAKMAVSKEYQNKGIGYLLGEAVILKAKELNANSLSLATNSVLNIAISLYKKLGFTQCLVSSNDYTRSNYNMELIIK